MNKILPKKLLIVISAFAFISYGVIWACADGDWDEFFTTTLSPEAFVDSSFKPFFFSDQFYYEIGHDVEHNIRFNDEVLQDWMAYLGKITNRDELQFWLFESSATMVDSVLSFSSLQLPIALRGMQMVQQKAEPKLSSFFKFLAFAKANEDYALNTSNYWDYDAAQQKQKSLAAVHQKNLSLMHKELESNKDAFIRQRYFFQVLRAYFFSGQYDRCVQLYEQYQKQFPVNNLALRCTGYLAGAYYKQKNYAQANYLYGKIFDAGDAFKTVAHFSFHPQNESDWQQTLALCKSKEEQITLWQLLGIYFDEARAIKEIYAINPKSEKLDLLLSRLVNKQERLLVTDWSYLNSYTAKSDDTALLSKLLLVQKIADAQNTTKPYFWHLSAGYLYCLRQDFVKASDYFNRAQKLLPNSTLAAAQLRLFQFINHLSAAPKIDATMERSILPDLLWLKNDQAAFPKLRTNVAYAWAHRFLANRYKLHGDFIKAELLHHEDSFYALPSNVLAMKQYLLEPSKDPYRQYLKGVYTITSSDIDAYQAVGLTFEEQYDQAIALMIASGNQDTLLGNPFNGNIKDCHNCDHRAVQKVKYTKLSFLYKLKELQANVQAGVDVFNNALLLGNAHYNMTHFGNARIFYEGAVLGYRHATPDMLPKFYKQRLLDLTTAKRYYQKALSVAEHPEQKAKLSYLLLKIERNEAYKQLFNSADYSSWDYAPIPKINFGSLLQYKDTKYYQQVIKECGYFRNYLSKNP